MNTDLLLLNHLENVSTPQRKFTILTETRQITDCPICYSFPKPNITENTELKLRFSERKCPVCGKHCGKPALLDLFSGAGGAARGYQKAGFCVLGVDIKPQPHYAGCRFIQADSLTYPLEGFDAYHASPPCQAYSRLRHLPWLKGKNYPALIGVTREVLVATNKPWVIENVADAPLGQEYGSIMLCGWSLAEMPIYRHRLFESNIALLAPSHRPHPEVIYPGGKLGSRYSQGNSIFGFTKTVPRSYGTFISVVGHDGTRNFPKAKEAMGIDWMNKQELTQAIPPLYTEYIGKYLMKVVMKEVVLV